MASEFTAEGAEPAQIERVTRRLCEEVLTARRYAVAEELFDPEFAYAAAPGVKGAQAKLRAIRGYHQSFPDLRATVDDLVISARQAAVRYTISGTDLGGLRGRPPTGRAVSVWGVDILGFRGNRIISDWVGVDWLGLLVQLGAIPDPWSQ